MTSKNTKQSILDLIRKKEEHRNILTEELVRTNQEITLLSNELVELTNKESFSSAQSAADTLGINY